MSNFSSSTGLQKDLYVVKKILTKAGSAANEPTRTSYSKEYYWKHQYKCDMMWYRQYDMLTAKVFNSYNSVH